MQQYYTRISKVLSEHPSDSATAVFATQKWCAPGAIDMMAGKFTKRFIAECRGLVRNSLEYARRADVQVVVIAACWYFYFTTFRDLDHFGSVAPLKPGAGAAFDGLASTIAELVKAGKRVYVVLDIPVGIAFDPHQMFRRSILSTAFTGVEVQRRAHVEQALQPVESKLIEAVQRAGGILINPRASMCNRFECPALASNGEPMYHDMWNLSPSYVATSASFIDQTIRGEDVAVPNSY